MTRPPAATATPGSAPSVRETDPASLAAYLLSFDWPDRNAAVEDNLVAGGLPLWRQILRLLPEPAEPGRLLELGSPPFHMTLLTQRLRRHTVVPTAAAADDRPVYRQRVVSTAFGEDHTFECPCFDIERDDCPFPDDHFDAVMFCEVIEHLVENPVFALHEIHRVLKPGGVLVLSTPNAARSGNIMRLWLGANVFDQYHLGAPLRGTRHSREYTLGELTALVGACGFRIEVAAGRNLGQVQFTRKTRPLEPFFRLFAALGPGVHADHLFVRAVKAGAFRWAFPPDIFDQGHLVWYRSVRDHEIVMGRNDIPHTGPGWGPLEVGGGPPRRRVEGEAEAYLRAGEAPLSVVIDAAAGAAEAVVEIEAWEGEGERSRRAAVGHFACAPGSRSVHVTAVEPNVHPGTPLCIRVRSSAAIYVHRIALEPVRHL